MKMKPLVLISFLFLIPLNVHAELDPVEKKIVSEAQGMSADAISFLEKIANINSGTMNLDGVRQVGKALSGEFESIGFKISWIEMPQRILRGRFLQRKKKRPRVRACWI
jgi:glutamate carboxypeptidase